MPAILIPVAVLDRLAQATLKLAREILLYDAHRNYRTLSRELLRRLWDGVELAEKGVVAYDPKLYVFYVSGTPTKKQPIPPRYMVRPGECECEDHHFRAPKGRCKHIAAVNAIVATGRFYADEPELDAFYRAESERFDVAYARDVLEETDFVV